MKNEKKNYPGVNIGSASMLVIFIILCLVTFAVLSVASANKDFAYSQKIAQRTENYYEASNKAEEILDEIDQILEKNYLENKENCLDSIPQELENLEGIDFSAFPEISYEIPMNENQALHISLSLRIPEKEGDSLYTITSWQEISTEEWDGDTTLNLI